MERFKEFLLKGFFLSRTAFKICLISLLFFLTPIAPSLLGIKFALWNFISLWLFLIGWSFSLSIPIFLRDLANQNYRDFFLTTYQSAKRLILFAVLLCILFPIAVFTFFLINLKVNPSFTSQSLKQFSDAFILFFSPKNNLFLYLVILPLLSSITSFTSIFFSLENNNIILSFFNGIKFGLRNLSYLGGVVLYEILIALILYPLLLTPGWPVFLRTAILMYFGFVLTCTNYLFFENLKGKIK